jgi:hypothetical protein
MNLDVLFDGELDLHRLRDVLDGLGHVGRLDTIRGWGHAQQEKLYEAASDFKPLTLTDFVPEDVEPMVEVIHWGKNSLPAFTHFQKRFCKPKEVEGELWGYNDNHEGRHQFATGPGYFVVHAPDRTDAAEGEIDIDYRKLPPGKPDRWPAIKPNEAGISRLIYAGMIDVMRGVSKHVSVGRALKGGQFMDAYFVLCRDDTPTLKPPTT